MKNCPGCGYPVKDDTTKCPLCASDIPKSGSIPVYAAAIPGVQGKKESAGHHGRNLIDVLSGQSAASSCLVFSPVAGGLRVIGLKMNAPCDIIVPQTHNGKTVTEIAASAFAGRDMVTVHIPSSVQTIGDHAFENCESLCRVTGCEGLLRIGRRAFAGCIHLTVCNLPSHPHAMRDSFAGCFKGTMALEADIIFDEGDA